MQVKFICISAGICAVPVAQMNQVKLPLRCAMYLHRELCMETTKMPDFTSDKNHSDPCKPFCNRPLQSITLSIQVGRYRSAGTSLRLYVDKLFLRALAHSDRSSTSQCLWLQALPQKGIKAHINTCNPYSHVHSTPLLFRTGGITEARAKVNIRLPGFISLNVSGGLLRASMLTQSAISQGKWTHELNSSLHIHCNVQVIIQGPFSC